MSDIGDLPRRVTRGGRWGAWCPLPFFRNWKKCPSFGQKCPDSGYLWVKFSFKMQFLRVSKKKPEIFPCGASFSRVVHDCLSKCPNSKKTPLHLKISSYAPATSRNLGRKDGGFILYLVLGVNFRVSIMLI